MTTPTQALRNEHRVIEQVLDSLAAFAQTVSSEDRALRSHLGRYVEFFRVFADACHHGKEEAVLFKELSARGMPVDGGPIGVMLAEHDQGRVLVRRLAAIAAGEGDLDPAEMAGLRETVFGFHTLLHGHIQKEDEILFAMADRMLPPEAVDSILDRYERFEREEMGEGTHERLHALAETLIMQAKA
jgi:hemerythrin-like domain-containing protein